MKIYHCLMMAGLFFAIPAPGQNQIEEELDFLHLPASIANKEARFYRPTIIQANTENRSFSLGGYASANTEYFVTHGEGDGLHFQLADLHLFAQTTFLNNRLHFITDVGFNAATQQFELTEAALNIQFDKAFNLRGGVVLPPLGYFNQNGDSPTTDFVDWPLVSTTIIPSRLSEVGFGINGTMEVEENLAFTYELYAVNGLQEAVVDNDLPRTAIDLGKMGNLFGEDNNGKLAYTGRLGIQQGQWGELGLSFYTGAYNLTEVNEVEIDESRNLSIFVIDGRFNIQKLMLKSEVAYATINLPPGLAHIFGESQMGYHLEATYPIWENISLLGQENNYLNLALRLEKADYNVGDFVQTETKIYDEIMGFRAGLALHLGYRTVLKANYAYFDERDILGNLSKTGGFQFGFSSYF